MVTIFVSQISYFFDEVKIWIKAMSVPMILRTIPIQQGCWGKDFGLKLVDCNEEPKECIAKSFATTTFMTFFTDDFWFLIFMLYRVISIHHVIWELFTGIGKRCWKWRKRMWAYFFQSKTFRSAWNPVLLGKSWGWGELFYCCCIKNAFFHLTIMKLRCTFL